MIRIFRSNHHPGGVELVRLRLRRIGWLLLSSMLLVASACGSDSGGEAGGTAEGGETDVTLLMAFVHSMDAVQFYFAEDLGYFDQCGLDVTMKTAANVGNPTQLVISDAVDYAIIDPLTFISAMHRGLPIAGIAQDTARTGVSYFSLKDTDIEAPEDLPGHRVGVNPGNDNLWFIKEIMRNELSPEDEQQVDIVPTNFSITPLLTGNVDVYSTWTTDESWHIAEENEGFEFNVMKSFEHGIRTMGNIIITKSERLEESPEEVRRFLAAVSAGREEVVPENRDEAVEAALKRIDKDVTPEIEERVFDEAHLLQVSPLWEEKGVGWHDPEAYEQTQQLLLDNGELEEALPVEELYTTEVLEDVFVDGKADLQGVCD